jgi:hypothetical protein
MKQNLPIATEESLPLALPGAGCFSHLPKKGIEARRMANGELMKLGDASFEGHFLDDKILRRTEESVGFEKRPKLNRDSLSQATCSWNCSWNLEHDQANDRCA